MTARVPVAASVLRKAQRFVRRWDERFGALLARHHVPVPPFRPAATTECELCKGYAKARRKRR